MGYWQQTGIVLLWCQYNSILNIWSADCCPRSNLKRESGASPERSGHCNRGATFHYPIVHSMRRGKEVMILKSGNLLCMARLNFRVKCNNQLRDIRSPRVLSAYWKQAFFYGIRLFVWIIPMCLWFCHHRPEPFKGMIKWQAVLLRMHSFPPHIMNGFIVYPGAASQILYKNVWMTAWHWS